MMTEPTLNPAFVNVVAGIDRNDDAAALALLEALPLRVEFAAERLYWEAYILRKFSADDRVAYDLLTRACDIDPGHAHYWSLRTSLAHDLRLDPALSLTFCDEAIRLDPTAPMHIMLRAVAIGRLGRVSEARKLLLRYANDVERTYVDPPAVYPNESEHYFQEAVRGRGPRASVVEIAKLQAAVVLDPVLSGRRA